MNTQRSDNIIRIALLFAVIVFQQSCRKIPDPYVTEPESVFDDCIEPGNSQSFEILTFNIQGFPKTGNKTFDIVKELIEKIDPDIIAFQEMAAESDFNDLADTLNGWEGIFYPVDNYPYNLAYLYKTSEIEIDNNKIKVLFTDDTYAFPRAPFEIYATHKTSHIGAYFINLHLKCCGGTDNEDRRRNASEKLENYLQSERSDVPVVILGDYNDEISGETQETNVFYNFIISASDYLFTDYYIAGISPGYWSYPSYPSHIDHILVTDELFSSVDTTMVLMPDKCYSGYFDYISDHRPVELILK